MKVLHVNKSDIIGGASIAGHRLHSELRRHSIESFLLVDSPKISDPNTFTIQRRRFLESLTGRIFFGLGLNYLHILGSGEIAKTKLYEDVDIINFHNLHGGYFNYLAIPELTKKKPAVFTLHDMWSFTGHCAYSFSCNRWEIGCGQCPDLGTYPAIARDNTALEWKLKLWAYSRSCLTIVTPSQWLANLAQKSILSRFSINHIPNGLDTDIYQPLEASLCRSALGIPQDKKILLFSAQSFNDPRKGSDLLISALQKLPASIANELVLITMGDGGEELSQEINIPVFALGYVGGDRLKSLVYSAADGLIFPTRVDNLPLVLQESIACGTPVLSFNTGGVPELVRSGITGLLAEPENPDDLAGKIMEFLEDDLLRQRMAQACREVAVAEYSIELQAKRYLSLYKQVLEKF
ncbi:MAG: glycosyl transferase [Leptolyngbya sp.]|nr:MAG: glycosyl transferase [Leptolyngbya sp.]